MGKTAENKNNYNNIRMLSELNKQTDMPELIKNIRDSKRDLDALLKKLKDKEKEFELAAEAIAAEQEQPVAVAEEMDLGTEIQSDEVVAAEIDSDAEVAASPQTIETAQTAAPVADSAKKDEDTSQEKPAVVPAQDLSVKETDAQPVTVKTKKVKDEQAETSQDNLQKPVQQADTVKVKQPESAAKEDKPAATAEAVTTTKPEQAKPKTAATAVTADATQGKAVKKAKTAEDRFKESLPKPVNTENRRFINLTTPERPAYQDRGRGAGGPRQPYNAAPGERRTFGNNAAGGQGAAGGFRRDIGANTSKPAFARPKIGGGMPITESAIVEVKSDSKFTSTAKKKTDSRPDDKKVMNKRTLLRRGFEADPTLAGDDVRMGSRKFRPRKKDATKAAAQAIKIEKAVLSTEIVPIKVLSDKLGITAAEITKRLFKEGEIKTINESVNFSTAELIALDLGIELELRLDKTAEDALVEFHEDEPQDHQAMVKRPPVVTVMGHVDHGKTSLLDAIKKTNVVEGEAGGITQHIGAYTVTLNGEPITFIDTPGHEAFTSMRARGASVTDIAILVVAADDGIMPQTIEAINHAKAADVPIIVAINKMDKQTANPERIKQQLTEHGLVPEEWGGDAIICPVSAVTRDGIDKLLEMVLLLAEVKELKANPDRKAKGTIIEAELDKGKGPVATVLVQNGTLRIGDTVVAGIASGRIRAMLNDKGMQLKEAGPSIAVSVLGFSEVPNAGDAMYAMEDERLSRQVAEERLSKIRTEMIKSSTKITLDDVFGKISEGQIKGLNLIVKADVQGSVEAIKQALEKLSTAEVKVNVIHGGVGAISESDVTLAQTAAAIIIGFNVRPDVNARQLSDKNGIDIRQYRVIYEVTEDVQKALKGMLEPKYKENVLGQAEVRNTFRITGVGTVAGCYVLSGKIVRNAKVRLLRDNVVVTEGDISSLKRFKDDVREVAHGFECGISIEGYNDIKESDVIECFRMEEIID